MRRTEVRPIWSRRRWRLYWRDGLPLSLDDLASLLASHEVGTVIFRSLTRWNEACISGASAFPSRKEAL